MIAFGHGLTPVGWWAPCSCSLALLPPCNRTEERIGRVKVWKLIGWDKDVSAGKAKVVYESKAKQGVPSLLLIVRQVFSHFQDIRAPTHAMVTWDKHLCLNVLPSSSAHVEPAVPDVSPPNFSCTPILLAGMAMWEAEEPWCCVSIAHKQIKHLCVTNSLCSTNTKHSPIQATVKKINSQPKSQDNSRKKKEVGIYKTPSVLM